MAAFSKIEWTEVTWNPVTGCTKVTQGCKHCYAERMALRLKAMGMVKYRNGFSVTLHEDQLASPSTWKKPSMVFVNSMSDLFHDQVPVEFIQKVFQTMHKNQHHTFQLLTKRSERLAALAPILPWSDNIWMGVTVESRDVIDRIVDLSTIPASVRFLSCEPLLEEIPDLPLDGIDWVIVGGESGPGARPMNGDWVESIRIQCAPRDIPFFFKQWGGRRKKAGKPLLNGVVYQKFPKLDAHPTVY